MTYRLLVKGNIFEASAACSARGIDHRDMKELHHGETVMETDAPVEKIIAWFTEDIACEKDGKGFPIGSLLHYTHKA